MASDLPHSRPGEEERAFQCPTCTAMDRATSGFSHLQIPPGFNRDLRSRNSAPGGGVPSGITNRASEVFGARPNKSYRASAWEAGPKRVSYRIWRIQQLPTLHHRVDAQFQLSGASSSKGTPAIASPSKPSRAGSFVPVRSPAGRRRSAEHDEVVPVDHPHRRWTGQPPATPTMGLFRIWLPIDPLKVASPNAKTPPSLATSQYPLPLGVAARPTMGLFRTELPMEP